MKIKIIFLDFQRPANKNRRGDRNQISMKFEAAGQEAKSLVTTTTDKGHNLWKKYIHLSLKQNNKWKHHWGSHGNITIN